MKSVFLILICALSLTTNAQIFIKSTTQQFIEQSSSPAFFLVKQSFQIADKNGKKFGWNGNRYFGITYSFGIKTTDGYYLNDLAVNPWNYDENFQKYKDEYTPSIFQTFVKELNDSTFSTVEIKLPEKKNGAEYYNVSDENLFSAKGLPTIISEKNQENWVMWISTEKELNQELKQDDIQFIIYKTDVDFSDKKSHKIDAPMSSGKLYGGIILTPDFSEIGIIKFKLSGLIAGKDKDWEIIPVEKNSTAKTDTKKVTKEKQQQDGALTPVDDDDNNQSNNKDKKRKK